MNIACYKFIGEGRFEVGTRCKHRFARLLHRGCM